MSTLYNGADHHLHCNTTIHTYLIYSVLSILEINLWQKSRIMMEITGSGFIMTIQMAVTIQLDTFHKHELLHNRLLSAWVGKLFRDV